MNHTIIEVERLISQKGFVGALDFLSSGQFSKINKKFSVSSALTKFISQVGVPTALMFLSADSFPEDIKKSLSRENFFVGGYPNVELISSLV